MTSNSVIFASTFVSLSIIDFVTFINQNHISVYQSKPFFLIPFHNIGCICLAFQLLKKCVCSMKKNLSNKSYHLKYISQYRFGKA
mmetsp:Transcript_15147/g.23082  ORF Transcript_15147/g.23082 Transcript_15147/m.23082 type:complete len:85 (-) Transcript_15147:2224-2478(-)